MVFDFVFSDSKTHSWQHSASPQKQKAPIHQNRSFCYAQNFFAPYVGIVILLKTKSENKRQLTTLHDINDISPFRYAPSIH
jgi:hypothetical protein